MVELVNIKLKGWAFWEINTHFQPSQHVLYLRLPSYLLIRFFPAQMVLDHEENQGIKLFIFLNQTLFIVAHLSISLALFLIPFIWQFSCLSPLSIASIFFKKCHKTGALLKEIITKIRKTPAFFF